MSELLNCPFCGGADIQHETFGENSQGYQCQDCGVACRYSRHTSVTDDFLRAKWNRRANVSAAGGADPVMNEQKLFDDLCNEYAQIASLGPTEKAELLNLIRARSSVAGMPDELRAPLTYLAAPYSHPVRDVRVARFDLINIAAAKFMSDGLLIYSPISHTHPIAEAGTLPLGWDFWQTYDKAFIYHSRKVIVLMLDGWKESKGVTAEIAIAKSAGIPVEYTTMESVRAIGGA